MFFLFQPFRGHSKKALVLFGIASLFISSTSAKYIDNFLTSSSLSPFYPSAALTFDKSNFWIRYNDTSFGKAATLANLFLVGSGNGTKKKYLNQKWCEKFSREIDFTKNFLYILQQKYNRRICYFLGAAAHQQPHKLLPHIAALFIITLQKFFLKFHFFLQKWFCCQK